MRSQVVVLILAMFCSVSAFAVPVNYKAWGEITLATGSNPWSVGAGDLLTMSGQFNKSGAPTVLTTYSLVLVPNEVDFLSFGGPGSIEMGEYAGGFVLYDPNSNAISGGPSMTQMYDSNVNWLWTSNTGSFSISDVGGSGYIAGNWITDPTPTPAPSALLVLASGLLLIVGRRRASKRVLTTA